MAAKNDNKICFVSDNIVKLKDTFSRHRDEFLHVYLAAFVREFANEYHIVSCVTQRVDNDEDLKRLYHPDYIPGGLQICGVCVTVDDVTSKVAVQEAYENLKVTHIFDPIVLAIGKENGGNVCLYDKQQPDGELKKLDYSLLDQESLNSWVTLRMQGSIPLSFETSLMPPENEANIQAGFKYLENKICQDTTAFHVDNSSAIFLNNDLVCSNLSISSECSQLFSVIETEDVEANKKARRADNFSQDVVDVSLLFETTGESAANNSITCAPVIHHEHKLFKQTTMFLPLDVIAYVHASDTLETVPFVLKSALARQLAAMSNTVLRHLKNDGSVRTPEPYHFKPPGFEHVLTVIYPKGVSDDDLKSEREKIHDAFQLPQNQPCVRRLNSFTFPNEKAKDGLLINVHEGVSPSNLKDGKVYTVQGRYAYHHYMQDRFNDDGWGCAYRSLQTLVSWFRLQGYTENPIPTHKEIQQILVDINDKPAKIIGSKSWIGSTEVSFVLDTYLGVTSKILFVNSGSDMGMKGRELAMHFQDQGTPVMIGGGVLAHTILGVDFDEVTGDVRFLILDPHYTGADNLKTIQDKGWCGWKGPDFWDQNAHYNMCMPQRPNMI